jgi:predicted ester cyclase
VRRTKRSSVSVEAVNHRDEDALDRLVSRSVVRHCPATPEVRVRSLQDLKEFLREDARAFPEGAVRLQTVVGEGDLVGFWATYEGTQTGPMGPLPPTGKRMSCEFSGIIRIGNGQIQHMWVTWDNLSLLGELGHLPPTLTEGSS